MRKLVVVIHTNPFRGCLAPRITPDPFDAYEGSTHFGELLVRLGTKCDVLCICGHRHKALDTTESGVRVLRSPVGYLDDFGGDYKEQAAKAVQVIEF